jgi:hypothetical protein
VLQHRTQHHAGTGPPPVAVGGAGHGGGESRCRGTGHEAASGTSSGTGPTLHRLVRRPDPSARLTRGGDRWQCPAVAGRHSDATRS